MANGFSQYITHLRGSYSICVLSFTTTVMLQFPIPKSNSDSGHIAFKAGAEMTKKKKINRVSTEAKQTLQSIVLIFLREKAVDSSDSHDAVCRNTCCQPL